MPDWWEQCIGSNASVANQNDDPNGDGWTLLEDYLDFMAHPYLTLQPHAEGTIDLRQHFAGFYGQNGQSVTPTYTVDFPKNHFNASIEGDLLKVNTSEVGGVGYCEVTVNDGQTTFTQRFGVAIIGGTTGIFEGRCKKDEGRGNTYNLHGQRLSQPQKGLNIVNGKKVIY